MNPHLPGQLTGIWPALQGLGLGASLIIAIGAQNAFVLRQGLRRRHLWGVALTCTLCDAALIALGVGGFGSLVAQTPALLALATWGGTLFLGIYGLGALGSALRPGILEAASDTAPAAPWGETLAATLAVSLLNPHVYLDTVVLVGSVGARFPAGERIAFALGAMAASGLWFFGLAYGAARLAPLFARPGAWRLLDLGVTAVMWSIALSLIRTALPAI